MAEKGTFTSLHPTTRKYVAGISREPLPAKLRELVERLHEAEPVGDPRERLAKEKSRSAAREKKVRAHH
jgi:hypothetical protein